MNELPNQDVSLVPHQQKSSPSCNENLFTIQPHILEISNTKLQSSKGMD